MKGNIVASYGAAVGTLALLLNFLRYRHAISGTKVKLKVEIVIEKKYQDFLEEFQRIRNEQPEYMQKSYNSTITHKIRVRNVGNVAVNIQDVWLETKKGRINGTSAERNSGMYHAVSQQGEVDLPARTSKSFSCFSKFPDGYLEPIRAGALDAMGKQWWSRRAFFWRK